LHNIKQIEQMNCRRLTSYIFDKSYKNQPVYKIKGIGEENLFYPIWIKLYLSMRSFKPQNWRTLSQTRSCLKFGFGYRCTADTPASAAYSP
ncbi:MAG: hypothetical protein J6S69_05700, partial [Proteobacteria bacterium]|nr:hypothetical protein [Pseudomonadota bacterium]